MTGESGNRGMIACLVLVDGVQHLLGRLVALDADQVHRRGRLCNELTAISDNRTQSTFWPFFASSWSGMSDGKYADVHTPCSRPARSSRSHTHWTPSGWDELSASAHQQLRSAQTSTNAAHDALGLHGRVWHARHDDGLGLTPVSDSARIHCIACLWCRAEGRREEDVE